MSTQTKVLTLFLIVSLVSAAAQDAEEITRLDSGTATASFERDVTVRLQLIDVTVQDGDGNYINNLTREDFRVIVNGGEMPISTFDVYYSGQGSSIESMASGKIPNTASPGRRIVLFFDNSYSGFQGFRAARGAAKEFVKRNLSPGDEVMIISYGRSFKIHTEFTRDREKMEQALEEMNYTMVGELNQGALFATENEHNVRVYLQALEDLSLYLGAWRGRKTMIMFSEGFAQPIAAYTLTDYLKDTLDSFSSRNVTVFSIDVAGLNRGRTWSPRLASMRRDTLSSFALETGGKFYHGTNDIQGILLDIDEDISNYYVLGVTVPEDQDSGFQDVAIEVTTGDYDLLYSPGFFTPEPFNEMSSEERLIHISEGFNLPTPIREFEAGFTAGVFPRNDGSAVASVAMEAPLSGSGQQEFEARGLVFGPEGNLLDGFHKTFTFTTLAKRFYHVENLILAPGENLIKLVLRDNTTGERCYHFLRARMPLLEGGLHASSIIFTKDEGYAAETFRGSRAEVREFNDNIAVEARRPVDPLSTRSSNIYLETTDVFRPAPGNGVVIKVSGVADRKQPALAVAFTARDEQGNRYELPVSGVEISSIPGTGEALLTAEVDFSSLEPGEYLLNAAIEDLDQERLAGQRTRITIAQ